MPEIAIPASCLVVLIGPSGSGKSTFAARHFTPTQVLSSDRFRGMVADDENDQSATADAFGALHHVAGRRLAANRLTVVDATNVQREDRAALVELAREHDVLPVAIVLDLPESVCHARNANRTDRNFGRHVIRRQRATLHDGLRGLQREGFRRVHVLRDATEVDAATVRLEPLYTDRRELTGPFDVIGDVHGCRAELEELLTSLGYRLLRDRDGHPVDAVHPGVRTAVFVGDLVDRGPDTPGVLRLAMGMVAAGHALAVCGNHEQKLLRALRGTRVRVSHGLAESLAQLAAEPAHFRTAVEEFCAGLVSHYLLDGGSLVVAHAGLPERYHGRASGRVRSFALYGQTTGETDEFGLPVRYPWAQDYRGRAAVLYGHTPVPTLKWVNNTLCLDTGCVFGGALTALRYPEREIVTVPAHAVHYEPVRPLAAAAPPQREDDLLDVADVLGKRVVGTRLLGRITVRAEQAAAALEVMSRFAIDPARLLYLPPTMAPCGTAPEGDVLEHPALAFDAYRAVGVREVICQRKHMGSRAVVLVRVDGTGALHTRTGRPLFDDDRGTAIVARISAAARRAGLFDDLSTDWLLLDTELMPWNAKAAGLIREQYASVATAAGAALPAALDALCLAGERGQPVADLLERTQRRAANAAAFAATYKRYCHPVDGLDGVCLAPFQVLAAAGASFADRDHGWHLEQARHLAEADPALLTTTEHVVVDTGDVASRDTGARWWAGLTAAGAEGMVVKPLANLTGDRLVQPALKVRGREYLRLIYGPDYTEPANLNRLRQRNLGHKRSLALREYALGLEGLARLAEGEPLWRVHECVFAVLACESEPVDPRL